MHDVQGFKKKKFHFKILVYPSTFVNFYPMDRWKARSQAVLTELRNFGADILCIQV